jgi:hypothetical protein
MTHSRESEPACGRCPVDFWSFFDCAGVVVPRDGEIGMCHDDARGQAEI